jgi:hypothetical protein
MLKVASLKEEHLADAASLVSNLYVRLSSTRIMWRLRAT